MGGAARNVGWLAVLALLGCPGSHGPSVTLLDDDSADDDTAGDDDATDDDATDDDDSTGDDDDVDCDVRVPGDVDDLQDAVDGALDGDVVCVEPGIHAVNLDFGGRSVHVLGLGGAVGTALDGGGLGSVVTFEQWEGPDAVLEGFSLLNGAAVDGGGLHVRGADPTLRDLIVFDNAAELDGGGVYLDASAARLEGLRIHGNTAGDDGGGVYLGASPASLARVEVTDNEAVDLGGGVCAQNGDPSITGAIVAHNRSDNDGGGLALLASDPTVIDALIADNAAAEDGGGVHAEDASPTLVGVALLANWAGNDGGGLAVLDGDAVLVNAALIGNTADDDGGGAYVEGGSLTASSSALVANAATSHGGAAACEDDAALWISHSDLYDNAPERVYGAADPVGEDGNVSTAPAWLGVDDGDPLDWDLHLHPTSPLVDAGSPALLDPDGSRDDIGVFGGPYADAWDLDDDGYPSWWTPGPYDADEHADLDCDDLDADVYPGHGC